MFFGQLVIGPPGSGKTTYCNGLYQFLNGLKRRTIVVNLDPANEDVPYPCAVDLGDLVDLGVVMEELGLGPNGGLVYCIDTLAANMNWLKESIERAVASVADGGPCYVLFDCPGQVELYTHHESMRRIVDILTREWDCRLAAVHLVDAHHCADAAKYISVLMVSLSTMIHMELPHVNVLSKVDLIEQYGKLAFPLEFYTDVQNLEYLVESMASDIVVLDDAERAGLVGDVREHAPSPASRDGAPGDTGLFPPPEADTSVQAERLRAAIQSLRSHNLDAERRYLSLSKALCQLIQDFALVSFATLDIQSKDSVWRLMKTIDKANGYVFGGLTEANDAIRGITAADTEWNFERVGQVQAQYMDNGSDPLFDIPQ